MNFAELLKQTRKRKGLSQEVAADSLNMSQATYSRYERGEVIPKGEILKVIAQFCELSNEEIQNIQNELNESVTEQKTKTDDSLIKRKETPVSDKVGQIVFLILIGLSIHFPICAWLAIYWVYINHFQKWVIVCVIIFALALTLFYLDQIYLIFPTQTWYEVDPLT